VPPALLARGERAYGLVFELAMIACLVLAWCCCASLSRDMGARVAVRWLVAWGLLACVALGLMSVQRYDALVALLVAVMCLAAVRSRPVVLGAAAGAAVAVKLVPGAAAVLCASYLWRQQRFRDVAVAAAVGAATVLAIAGPVAYAAGSTIDRVMWYHIDRPLEIETTAAALIGLWHSLDPSSSAYTFSFGSHNLTGPIVGAGVWASNIAAATALGVVYAIAWRDLRAADARARQARILGGSIVLALASLITLGKVSSPQYYTWLVPLGTLMTLLDGRRSSMLCFLAAMALPQAILGFALPALVGFAPWAYALVLLRNGLLLVWAVRVRTGSGRAARAQVPAAAHG
jgi:hypothetical protein